MYVDIFSGKDIDTNIINNTLHNKNFYEIISNFYNIHEKLDLDIQDGFQFADWIVKLLQKDWNSMSKDMKSIIWNNLLIGSNIIFRFPFYDEDIINTLKQKIIKIYDYLKKREENKIKEYKETSTDEKLNYLIESVYKIMHHSYLSIQSEESFNKELLSALGINWITFYDLETTTTNYETILWFYFSIRNDGTLSSTFSLWKNYAWGYFEDKLKKIVENLNKEFPKIRTQYRIIDNLYKEQMHKMLKRKDFLLIGYNSLKFDNKVLAESILDDNLEGKEKTNAKNILEKEMYDISVDLLEFYKTVGNNSSLDVLLANNLVKMNKLMSHEELLPMLNKDYLENKANEFWITKFIYYNTFDVILLALLFFQNFKKDSVWYKELIKKEIFIEYIKGITDKLNEKRVLLLNQ